MTRSVVQLCPWAFLLDEFVFFNREEGFVLLSMLQKDIFRYLKLHFFMNMCFYRAEGILSEIEIARIWFIIDGGEFQFLIKENCLKQQLETTFSSSSYRRSSLLCTLLTTVFYRMER